MTSCRICSKRVKRFVHDSKECIDCYYKMKTRLVCKVCNKIKTRYFKVINNKITFTDKWNKTWVNPGTCPPCHRRYKTDWKRDNYAKQKEILVLSDECFDEVPLYYSHKGCDLCYGKLELSRYKTCLKCKPNLPSDTEAPLYGFKETLGFKISEMPIMQPGILGWPKETPLTLIGDHKE